MDTVSGDAFLAECARFIRYNEAKLGNVPGPSSAAADGASWYNPVSWLPRTESTTARSGSALRHVSSPPQRGQSVPSNKGKTPAVPQQTRVRPLPLRVSAHHLYYILLRCESMGLAIGQLDVRIPAASRPASYFAFVSSNAAGSGSRRKDRDDTMSVSSLQTTMSTLGALGSGNFKSQTSWWSSVPNDPLSNIKFIYSAMTKIPALRIIPPPLKLIRDFEDCPGDMSVPMDAFKNVQYLEFEDSDPRSFVGWDRLSYQLKSLSMKRSGVEDVTDIIIDAVIYDGKRRRGEPVKNLRRKVHAPAEEETESAPDSVDHEAPLEAVQSEENRPELPSLSWHFLRHLGLSDNSLTFLHATPMSFVTGLTSLDLSNNLLNVVPPCLHLLPNLKSLNVANNLIDSVLGIPSAIPSIEALNLSRNRLESLCGLERLPSLRRIDLRHNEIMDAGEVGRLAVPAHLVEVFAAHNPIYEDEDDARVLIFTEFARDGIDIDFLKLDDEAAGYFEKQRVREKVPNLDYLVKARSRRQNSSSAFSTTRQNRPTSSPQQAATQASDGVAAPVVRNVRHRGGPRHGSREERKQVAEREAQRRNRRVVELNDSVYEEPDVGQGSKSEQAGTSTTIPREATDSEAIKKAAREGKLEEAMGTIRLATTQNSDGVAAQMPPEESNGSAAEREPAPRSKIGRRGKQKSVSNGAEESAAAHAWLDEVQETSGSSDTAASRTKGQDAGGATATAGGGEDLRRRIEALKGEVGDDWMRLLARGESVYIPSSSTSSE